VRYIYKPRYLFLLALVTVAVLGIELLTVAYGQSKGADPWPRQMQISGGTMTVYQPQVDSWDGGFLKVRAAVSVKPSAGDEVFGLVRVSAHTLVDRSTRMVTLFNFSILQIDFPSLPDHGQKYYADLGRFLPAGTKQVTLDRLQAFLSVEKITPRTVAVKNAPPQIIFSDKPAVLVPISSSPVLRQLPDSSLKRIVNTRALIVYGPSGEVFLHVYDGWMAAPGLGGPWHVATGISPSLDQIANQLARSGEVDLLKGDPKERPSLSTTIPAIYVSYAPAELIVFKGQPSFQPIAGTQLLWVSNSSGDVIMDMASNQYYVLISGRWFRASSLTGPWSYVAGNDLPADFRRIPPSSPSAEVLAAVPGTPQAKEAVIANSIPQTALIPREGGPKFTPVIDGSPQLRPIEGTSLQYVWNSPDAVIEVNPANFYALRNGVWFTATSLQGPWSVATSVPDAIYAIPPSSPLHYVTYVDIYWASAESVEVGYTPGYMGTAVAPDGVVVYGTGYDYTAWVGTAYYPPPPTYGHAAYPAYDAAADAMFGFALGMTTEALLAPAPAWGPTYYNDYYAHGCCWAAGSENIYGHYGSTTYDGYHDYGYNPYTGNVGATGNYHTYNAATGGSSNINAYHGYNAYTGTEGAGYNRQYHNQDTGTSADVNRSAAYNPETGNWEKGGSGTAYNPNNGASAQVQHTSEGNAYHGTTTGATTATVTNRQGQTNTYEAGHAGNNVYAGSDGNVYRNNGSGWEKNTASGWQHTDSSFNSSNLDRWSQSRSWGENWYSSFSNRGYYGGNRFGGGGGFRRFGGRF
jgi:hypothetical protein